MHMLHDVPFVAIFRSGVPLVTTFMPSTRREKAKARKSRKMDFMSDFENMDVLLGNENTNLIERELSDVIGNSENHCNVESGSKF